MAAGTSAQLTPRPITLAPPPARGGFLALPSRLHGLDAARGLAIIGMIIAHAIPLQSTLANYLPLGVVHGRSAALFVVVAGLTLGLTTGGPDATRQPANVQLALVFARVLALVPLALFTAALPSRVYTILGCYALWFVLAAPLLRAPAALVLTCALVVIVAGWAAVVYFGPFDIWLVTTGAYPAVPWLGYLLLGLACARFNIRRSATVLSMLGGGLVMAIAPVMWAANHGAALCDLTGRSPGPGLPVAPSAVELRAAAANLLPHSDAPAQVLHAAGCALVVIAACLLIARVSAAALLIFAVPGTMALSIYVAHLFVLSLTAERSARLGAALVLLMVAFAFVWRRFFTRGPLEHYVSTIAHTAGNAAKRNIKMRTAVPK